LSDDAKKVPPLVERRMAFARKQAEAGKGVLPRWAAGERAHGTGAPNRHGMPKLPPGQRAVPNWPVLDLGDHPNIPTSAWKLTVGGLVEQALELSFDDLLALPQVEEDSDFHCVTTWSRMDMRFGGVRLIEVLGRAGLREGASHLLVGAYDRDWGSGEHYSTNVPLSAALDADVLLVHTWNGQPLPREHGGPVRMVTPKLYAWKGAKWIRHIEVLDHDEPGFWERRGYSMSALPWYEDRYRRRDE
jgi:DMSO/TMAO reductase YedYZ molybdopterin-dependent catalytic subunit